MRLKLMKNREQVEAVLDEEYGIIVLAVYSESGIPLDEVEMLELELEYSDVINEYLNP